MKLDRYIYLAGNTEPTEDWMTLLQNNLYLEKIPELSLSLWRGSQQLDDSCLVLYIL
jgi:hypothetical protein